MSARRGSAPRLVAGGSAAGATFAVRDAAGTSVYSAGVGPHTRSWSGRFPNVYRLDFDAVGAPGTYTIVVSGPAHATSPSFRIDAPAGLFEPMIADARLFFEAQRDGRDVIGSVLHRRPSHLNDARATAYAPPAFDPDDALVGDLSKVGGPVDVAGGWFDAGDYLKFVETHSYALDLLLVALRDHPMQMGGGSAPAADFTAEARFGLRWLSQMWDDASRTLYYQVGIGDGDGCDEICGDRAALVAHGFRPVDFAYPFGSYTKATERIVQRCGYAYARAAWGLWGSGCEEEPATCPYAVDPANLGDPWAIPTADAPIDLTYVENQRRVVDNAIAHGGGWVQFFFHRICPDDCDEYSWTPASLDAFLTWLDPQRSAGALVVRTMREVVAPAFHPAVAPPAPPAPPRGPNRLRNASLERRAKGAAGPTCWEQQGSSGAWARVRGPHGRAEAVTITGAPDGFAALATPQDQGECSPAVHAGEHLVVRASYRSPDGPRFVVWARSKAGGWSFWRQSPRLVPAAAFRRASWSLPRVPHGVTALSVGLSLAGDGRLAADDLSLAQG